jgi:hypothetical protein
VEVIIRKFKTAGRIHFQEFGNNLVTSNLKENDNLVCLNYDVRFHNVAAELTHCQLIIVSSGPSML